MIAIGRKKNRNYVAGVYETDQEKKTAQQREAAAKASSEKEESGRLSVLLDLKPCDDETDMKKLEEAIHSVEMPGPLWEALKLASVGYGIKKRQIMMTNVDDLISMDFLIGEHPTFTGPTYRLYTSMVQI